MKKGQVSVEFIVLIGFILFLFVAVLTLFSGVGIDTGFPCLSTVIGQLGHCTV